MFFPRCWRSCSRSSLKRSCIKERGYPKGQPLSLALQGNAGRVTIFACLILVSSGWEWVGMFVLFMIVLIAAIAIIIVSLAKAASSGGNGNSGAAGPSAGFSRHTHDPVYTGEDGRPSEDDDTHRRPFKDDSEDYRTGSHSEDSGSGSDGGGGDSDSGSDGGGGD